MKHLLVGALVLFSIKAGAALSVKVQCDPLGQVKTGELEIAANLSEGELDCRERIARVTLPKPVLRIGGDEYVAKSPVVFRSFEKPSSCTVEAFRKSAYSYYADVELYRADSIRPLNIRVLFSKQTGKIDIKNEHECFVRY